LVLGFLGKGKLSDVFLLLSPLEDAADEVAGILMSAFKGTESKVAGIFMNSFEKIGSLIFQDTGVKL
jgi:hypothetical protein